MRTDTFVYHADDLVYPDEAPFHPHALYPELEHLRGKLAIGPRNQAFEAVRAALAGFGLDRAHFDSAAWNPLGALARPGQTIVLKPNLVLHELPRLAGLHCLCTHGAIVRAMIDYAAKAVGADGRVIVADVPLQGADFGLLQRQLGLDRVASYCRDVLGYKLEILDLRREWAVLSPDGTQILRRVPLPGDPEGYTVIDLRERSFLEEYAREGARFGITDYDGGVTNTHHRTGRHEYMLANTVLRAAAVINLPKMKTHQKAGLTAAMKNLVGINGSKEFLAHHRVGAPSRGGDEFPIHTAFHVAFREVRRLLNARAPHWLWRAARRVGLAVRARLEGDDAATSAYAVNAGGWYGNETLWRTIYDINRAFFDFERDTIDRRRHYLALVDGIVAGEGNGPLQPRPVASRTVVVGESPMAVDLACARIMGLDYRKIPFLREHERIGELPLDLALGSLVTTSPELRAALDARGGFLDFATPLGWRGHLEM
jgi:uncharacterized protein (DUF362 family)